MRLLWVMVNGSFLESRGAIHSVLAANGFADDEIRRSGSALRYGAWAIAEVVSAWQVYVAATNEWRARRYEGYRVKSVDITGFWRPRLQGKVNQHHAAIAQRALPAMIFGVMITSGEIQGKRLPLLHAIVRCQAATSEAEFRVELLKESRKSARPDEITVVDAGFELSELHEAEVKRFVVRLATNGTARTNQLPPYRRFRFMCCMDPSYKKPMVLATDLPLQAETVYLVYRDRWPVEQAPLAAKQWWRRSLWASFGRPARG